VINLVKQIKIGDFSVVSVLEEEVQLGFEEGVEENLIFFYKVY
jgi:hypothetical protein